MEPLNLNIDALKFPVPAPSPSSSQPSFLSKLLGRQALSSRKRLGNSKDLPVPSGYDASDYEAFLILHELLQPRTSLSISTAVTKLVHVFNDGNRRQRAVNTVALELAEQIPYNHPSQLKLAYFMDAFGNDARRIQKWNEKHRGVVDQSFQHLFEDVVDNEGTPEFDSTEVEDGTSPSRYNFQAFSAKLVSTGAQNFEADLSSGNSLRAASDENKAQESLDAEVRDACVIGAAQWILWGGQRLFQLLLWQRISGGDARTTIEDWGRWRVRFSEVADSNEHGGVCREVARKAAAMMSAIENALT